MDLVKDTNTYGAVVVPHAWSGLEWMNGEDLPSWEVQAGPRYVSRAQAVKFFAMGAEWTGMYCLELPLLCLDDEEERPYSPNIQAGPDYIHYFQALRGSLYPSHLFPFFADEDGHATFYRPEPEFPVLDSLKA